jgi:glycerol-3-phosphate acyltransferase PlsY
MFASAILMICIAYLSGSLSSAIIISRLFHLPDPRLFGSQNPGATNIYRLGGRFPAVFVLFFDILKGLVPVYLAYWWNLPVLVLGLVGIAACLGHSFPLYFGFKGGKAVATAFGALLPIGLPLAGALIASWLCVVFVTGYSSLGAIVATFMAPVFTYFLKPEYTPAVCMLSGLIIIRHHKNIVRLIQKEEPTIWQKKR